MKQRAPNGQKHPVLEGKNGTRCHFLHARLSIIDLESRADQPFHYKDKTIIFNGEIYNYIEVRETLKKLGHQFQTESDTEVLIHALDQWGVAALTKVEGMWAFALYNHTSGVLTLSRDPFGEKPLHYYQPAPGEFYSGSEVKFLSGLSGVSFTPNTNHVRRFLVNGYKSLFKGHEGFFVEVQSVPRASVLEITPDGRQTVSRYWHPVTETNSDLSLEDAVAQTPDLLIKSVTMSKAADLVGARTSARFRTMLRTELYQKFLALGPIHLARLGETGALTAALVDEIEAFDGFVARYLPLSYTAMLLPLEIAGVVLVLNVPAGLVLVGGGRGAALPFGGCRDFCC